MGIVSRGHQRNWLGAPNKRVAEIVNQLL
uniref:Uncharacterized protein n=1 Tax=Rhizophora mucronata TaxID=61149 RepID=A0A2P2QB71_RHIMU